MGYNPAKVGNSTGLSRFAPGLMRTHMELLTLQHIAEAAPRYIISACEDTDTCPACGAGYRVGLSVCEFCKRPVSATEGWDD